MTRVRVFPVFMCWNQTSLYLQSQTETMKTLRMKLEMIFNNMTSASFTITDKSKEVKHIEMMMMMSQSNLKVFGSV